MWFSPPLVLLLLSWWATILIPPKVPIENINFSGFGFLVPSQSRLYYHLIADGLWNILWRTYFDLVLLFNAFCWTQNLVWSGGELEARGLSFRSNSVDMSILSDRLVHDGSCDFSSYFVPQLVLTVYWFFQRFWVVSSLESWGLKPFTSHVFDEELDPDPILAYHFALWNLKAFFIRVTAIFWCFVCLCFARRKANCLVHLVLLRWYSLNIWVLCCKHFLLVMMRSVCDSGNGRKGSRVI